MPAIIAKDAGHLTVFQRTPNWCAPSHNSRISEQESCHETPGCFIHSPDPRSALEVSPEEREAFWERLYGEPGFGIWQAHFRDILVDREANALISEFVARKIRGRVKYPAVANKLIPKNHGLGSRRLPLETHYYEVYNQPNVTPVDINETPIERITPAGIKTSDAEHEFDLIIYATGFDAITGAFDRINIRGVDGRRIRHARDHKVTWIEATPAGTARWTDHVKFLGAGLLANEVDSWMTGINRNIEGKQTRRIMRYGGGYPSFREHCDAVAAEGYRDLALASGPPNNNRFRSMPFLHRHGRLSPLSRDFRDRSQAIPAPQNAIWPNAIWPTLRAQPRAHRFHPILWTPGSRAARSTTPQKPRPENLSHFLRHFPQSSGPQLLPVPRPAPLRATPPPAIRHPDQPPPAAF
jgi:hypothetical protein